MKHDMCKPSLLNSFFLSTTRIKNEPGMLLSHRLIEKNKNKIEQYTVSDPNNVPALLTLKKNEWKQYFFNEFK